MTRGSDDLLRLGLFYPIVPVPHVLAPQVAESVPDILSPASHTELMSTAEAIGLDYMFMADIWSTYGPVSAARHINSPSLPALMLAAIAATVTSRLGIISTVHTSYLHPSLIARYGAGLDALSGGRWAMNVVSGSGYADGLVPEPARSVSHDERYDLVDESLRLVRALWTGELVEHEGLFFQVSGTLNGPLPVAPGGPPVVSAGASDAGLAVAARYADYLFVPAALDAAKLAAMRERFDPHLRRAGRAREEVAFQVNPVVVLRDSDEEAEAAVADIRAGVDLDVAREYIATMMGYSQTFDSLYKDHGIDDDALRDRGVTSGARRIVGGPETVARELIELHALGIRGLAMNFVDWHSSELRRFGDRVLPLLRDAGVWSPPQERGYSW
jgi:FMNH2-dependent dimethyl sulfone monooxygenase